MFKAPYRAFTNHEFGAAFSDPGEGVSFALEGFYGYGRGPMTSASAPALPTRAGPIGGGTRILLGGDFRTRWSSYSESFPLDGALTVGVGVNLGDGDDLIYLPLGSRSAGASSWKAPRPHSLLTCIR